MPEITHVSVVIHPHFFVAYDDMLALPQAARGIGVKLGSKLSKMAAGNPNALKTLQHLERLQTFYRREVDRIARRPRSVLVLVKGVQSDFEEDYQTLREGRKIPASIALAICRHGIKYQTALVAYAAGKLGSRLWLFEKKPETLGQRFKSKLAQTGSSISSGAEVHTFGETQDACVRQAHDSLRKAGFKSNVINAKCQK